MGSASGALGQIVERHVAGGLPYNAVSQKPYSGINVVVVWLEGEVNRVNKALDKMATGFVPCHAK
jgi:hypothetical protein